MNRDAGGVIVGAIATGLCLSTPGSPCGAQEAGDGPGPRDHQYLFYEAERIFTDRGQWQVQVWNNPSGGEWIFGEVDWASPSGEVELPHDGPWFVWVRNWDWGQVDRRVVIEVNGEESYPCGGDESYQWIWYHTHVVRGPAIAMRLASIDPMGGWVDCIALTDDPFWVPPHEMANPAGYVSNGPYERLCRKPALIWPRVHRDQEELLLSAYRRAFWLQGVPTDVAARLVVSGTGFWTLWVNGVDLASGEGRLEPVTLDIAPALIEGPNALCLELEGGQRYPAVRVDGAMRTQDGWTHPLHTSPGWKASREPEEGWLEPDFDDRGWGDCYARAMEKPFWQPEG